MGDDHDHGDGDDDDSGMKTNYLWFLTGKTKDTEEMGCTCRSRR